MTIHVDATHGLRRGLRRCRRSAAQRLTPLFLLLLFAIPNLLSAQTILVTHPETDPTEFGSLRMDPSDAAALAEGTWAVTIVLSYFNQWDGTWHTRRSHEGLGLEREPVSDEEIRLLEESFPDDAIYRADVEGSRADFVVSHGLARGMTVTARLPWIRIGSPNWDAIGEEFHSLVPVNDQYARDLFPRSDTFLYIRGSGGRVVGRRPQLDGDGIGDTTFSLSAPMGTRWGAGHRLAISVQAPTGEKETLRGSGGWDAGGRWFAAWEGRRRQVLLGAGYTYQSRSGLFLGLERSDTVHLSADALQKLTRRTSLHLGARIDSSPLARIINENLGEPALYYRLGLVTELRGGHQISFDLGDEFLPQLGIDADWSFHVGWSIVRPAPRR